MKVRLIIGASAYAHITTSTQSVDVKLEPGRGAPQSLRESAIALREEANRKLVMAHLYEQAALELEIDDLDRNGVEAP